MSFGSIECDETLNVVFVYDFEFRWKFTMKTLKLQHNWVRSFVSLFLSRHCTIAILCSFSFFFISVMKKKKQNFWYSFSTPHTTTSGMAITNTITMTLTSIHPLDLLLRLFPFESAVQHLRHQKLFHQLCIKLWIFLPGLWRICCFFFAARITSHLHNNLFFDRAFVVKITDGIFDCTTINMI